MRWIRGLTLVGMMTLAQIAPAQAAVMHHYIYYPAHRVYFEPDRQQWFWYYAGTWWNDRTLPHRYVPLLRDGVEIELDTDRPYEQQAWVEQQYGKPPQIEPPRRQKDSGRDRYPTVSA